MGKFVRGGVRIKERIEEDVKPFDSTITKLKEKYDNKNF